MQQVITRLATAALFLCSFGAEGQIVYQVNRTVGTGTIVGTIETDGTLGALSTSNIVGWSFDVFDGTDTFNISSASGGQLQGNAWPYLSATGSELSFDFDAAAADDSVELIAFNGGPLQTENFDYNLVGSAIGKREQLVHQFGTDGAHITESDRDGVVVIAGGELYAACAGPAVSLGEVMAGLQAGLTGGTHTAAGNPEGFVAAAIGESRRGFVVPESEAGSTQCDNDYILVGEWFACPLTDRAGQSILTPTEARECVDAGLSGLIVDWHLEVDGSPVDYLQTATKMGSLFDGRRGAFFNAGHIIEPYSLAPGLHTATAVFEYDLDCLARFGGECDGVVDWIYAPMVNFEIVESGAAAQ
ncbi:MAG: hypothetical protein OEW35_13835 [Gammaproteobacteria bacterium]|nr:hypothetical protein [Gammaproteobacteria bacterium]MDH4255526.1 hypothetical protein [Gammaproteobacteria bacterium]MDH5311292.1 hypothetical protein [Gammaproteobacteria bacterium]